MSETREHKAKEIQDSIRKILYHEWDPIGVAGSAPYDEYDAYIGQVYRILASSRSESELCELLSRTERETIGVPAPESWEHLKPVVRRLLEIDVNLCKTDRSV